MTRAAAQSDLRILLKRRNARDLVTRLITRGCIHAVIRAVRAAQPQEAS
jgi:hypothetical protein